MSFLSGGNWTSDPRERSDRELVQERRATRSDRLCEATIACRRCDAPVAIGPDPLGIAATLTCPFCGHAAPVRDFLSLTSPTRSTHVVLRVRFGGDR